MEDGENKTTSEVVARAPRRATNIVFESGVIRLTSKDFEQWRQSFPHLSLRGELEGLSDWASRQDHWFPAVASALAKRERQAVERLASENAPQPLFPEAIYRNVQIG